MKLLLVDKMNNTNLGANIFRSLLEIDGIDKMKGHLGIGKWAIYWNLSKTSDLFTLLILFIKNRKEKRPDLSFSQWCWPGTVSLSY